MSNINIGNINNNNKGGNWKIKRIFLKFKRLEIRFDGKIIITDLSCE